MINNPKTSKSDNCKLVDDSTVAETVVKDDQSQIQSTIDNLVSNATNDKCRMNESKCKELHISFSKTNRSFKPITINGKHLEVVKDAKILKMIISSNLKLNTHVSEIVKKPLNT